MRRRSPLFPALVVSLASACGARSEVTEGATHTSSTTGMGGAATTSTSASTGGGGGIALQVQCDAVNVKVEVESPILTIGDAAADLGRPGLVVLDSAVKAAALVFAKQALPAVTGPSAQLASFAAWGDWPPPAPAIVDLQATDGVLPADSFVAAPRTAQNDDSFALLYIDGAGFLTEVAPKASLDGDVGLTYALQPAEKAAFLSSGFSLNQFLGGAVTPDGAGSALDFAAIGAGNPVHFSKIGCASTPIAADAAAYHDEWLFGAALGTELSWDEGGLSCAQKFASIGAATKVHFGRIEGWAPPTVYKGTATTTIDAGAPVTRLRMAPRNEGAWAVWSTEGVPGLRGVTLTGWKPEMGASFAVLASSGEIVPTSFDVAAIGDLLVVAAASHGSGGADQLRVVAVDAIGTVKWSTSFAAEGTVDGAVSVKAWPIGAALLVAWSELPAGASEHRLRVARLDCFGG